MSDMKTMVRTEISVNGRSYYLAQDQDARSLRAGMEGAVRAGGGFVEFTEVGNRVVSVIVTPASQVVFTTETVQFDERDTGDLGVPYGGLYDL
ncbi:hypothetical protein [Microbacterium marinilacus]|nr:hypothetical protein [Microbacterium marinilacus]